MSLSAATKKKAVKRAVLVYQAGIANVFQVNTFNMCEDGIRKARRLYQGDFRGGVVFARGMGAAGCIVRTAACNQAGDIADAHWTDDLEAQPFSEHLTVVREN